MRTATRIAAALTICLAQMVAGQADVLTWTAPARIAASPGAATQAVLAIKVGPGFHANSNTPADPYLIPMRLTWDSPSVETVDVVFPKPHTEKLGFSKKPVSVFTGNFDIVTRFRVADNAAPGVIAVKGKLHYQACDETSCLPPATLEVTLPVEIVAKNR